MFLSKIKGNNAAIDRLKGKFYNLEFTIDLILLFPIKIFSNLNKG
jgi:hypothetical protein